MARWIPENTLDLVIKEYDGVLKAPKGKSIYTLFGGNEEGRRATLFKKSYSREVAKRRKIAE